MKVSPICFLVIAMFSLKSLKANSSAMQKPIAFPGAEGFGKYATGGRGGEVVEVANLNDDGEGSLRAALSKFPKSPLTVVFNISGIIELKSNIKISRANLTIAGQTAPGDGICLKNKSLIINGASGRSGNNGNIIIRYIRSRPGGTLASGLYGIDLENTHDVMIDHCSFSWANEECAAMYDVKNITFQWCIVSEGLYNAGHAKGKRSYGGVWGGQNASYHHNLIANQNSRTARFNGSRAHDTIAVVDYRNNVILNWGSANACYGGEVDITNGRSEINMVNNYYIPGPSTAKDWKFIKANYNPAKAKGTGRWYIEGNVMKGSSSLTANNIKGIDLTELPENERMNAISVQPFAIEKQNEIEKQSAKDALAVIVTGVGANFPKRDAVDQRIIDQLKGGDKFGEGTFGKPGIIDGPDAVGGWPVYNSLKSPLDTDHDGMPDSWEKMKGLNSSDAADKNILDKNGYTMIETYLNGILMANSSK